jgi:hypothetical protein
VARTVADADPDARRLLDDALAANGGPITVMGVGYGRFAGYPDAEPASWLLERGLLLPVTYSQLVAPREAALGLRGGLVFPDWPQPPSAATQGPGAGGIAEAEDRAAAAATRAVVAAEGVCARLDREPLGLVRAGTVAVRDLARLESAQYHVERVIELRDRQSRFFGLVTAEDAILLVAVGEVTAGVDLSLLREADVAVDRAGGMARLTLPAPQVLSVRLDNGRTWTYSRTTDLLAQRHEDLETRARQEAERTLEQSALEGGILDRAREQAARTIESLVHSLGYAEVTIAWREAEPQ